MKQGLLLCAAVLVFLGQFQDQSPAFAERDLAFEQKSAQWMKQSRQVDEAIKAGKLTDAEGLLKALIADRVTYYNSDLSPERAQLAQIYEKMGKNEQAEALYKINIKTREGEDGANGYTLEYPLNEYADFLDRIGRKDDAKVMRDRANAIEHAANKEGEKLLQKEKQEQAAHVKHKRHN